MLCLNKIKWKNEKSLLGGKHIHVLAKRPQPEFFLLLLYQFSRAKFQSTFELLQNTYEPLFLFSPCLLFPFHFSFFHISSFLLSFSLYFFVPPFFVSILFPSVIQLTPILFKKNELPMKLPRGLVHVFHLWISCRQLPYFMCPELACRLSSGIVCIKASVP